MSPHTKRLAFIVAAAGLFFPCLVNSSHSVRNYSIVPVSSTFYLSLNTASYSEADKACRAKSMILACMNRSDFYQVFAPEGSKVWIREYGGLGQLDEGKARQPALMFVHNRLNSNIMNSYPTLHDAKVNLLYLCQESYTAG